MSTHDTAWRHQQKAHTAIVTWQCLFRLPRSAVTLGWHGRLSLSQRWPDGSPSSKSTHCGDDTLRVRASAPDVSEINKERRLTDTSVAWFRRRPLPLPFSERTHRLLRGPNHRHSQLRTMTGASAKWATVLNGRERPHRHCARSKSLKWPTTHSSQLVDLLCSACNLSCVAKAQLVSVGHGRGCKGTLGTSRTCRGRRRVCLEFAMSLPGVCRVSLVWPGCVAGPGLALLAACWVARQNQSSFVGGSSERAVTPTDIAPNLIAKYSAK